MLITSKNRKWWILAATTSATSLVFLGQTIINVSLSIIQKEFNASETQVQWVVNSYLLILASLSIAAGRFTDIIGAKHCFIYGIAFFTLSSIACGFAQSLQILILGRAVQGIGGALLIPATTSICINAFHPHERGRAVGIQMGISGIFISLGPFLGGILTEFFSWRWVFWINFPFALLAVLFALIALSTPELPRKKENFGFPGLICLSLGLSLLVIGIMQGTSWGWDNPITYLVIVIGFIFQGIFLLLDRKMQNPFIDLTLVKNRIFIVTTFLIVVAQSAQIITIFFAIYIQNVLGYSPFWAGVLMIPATLPQFFMPLVAGKLNDHKGPNLPVTTGLIALTIAVAWICLSVSKTNYFFILPGLVLIGFSVSLITIPSSTTAYNICSKEKIGFASGFIGTSRLMASSISLAITGAIITFVGQTTFLKELNIHQIPLELLHDFDPSEILSKNTEVQNILKPLTEIQKNNIFQSAIDAFDRGFTRSLYYITLICFISIPIAFFNLRKIKPPLYPYKTEKR